MSKPIDTSAEAVARRVALLRQWNGPTYPPEAHKFDADLLDAMSAKLAEAERERDGLRAALQITTPTVRFDDRHRAAFTLLASIARYDWNDEPSLIRRALDDFVEQARELTISPSVDPTSGYVDSLTAAIVSRDAAISELARLKAALTPSADTKADYIGEFKYAVTLLDQNGDERNESFAVPWTTIKEIMAHILARATPPKDPAHD